MSKVVTIQLEWTYTPKNYIEERICLVRDQYELSISEGIAIAKIEPAMFSQNETIKEEITALIESKFHAIQIISHSNYTLSSPFRTDLTDDGKTNVFIEVKPGVIKIKGHRADLVYTDSNGIVVDTKKERLEKQEWISNVIEKYQRDDNTLNQLLTSYQETVNDPNNELVHLYEVRDAISTKFGGHKEAQKQLGITQREWNKIGEIANQKPLNQGRHRGQAAGKLRDAEQIELETARKCVTNLIEQYLTYLKRK